MPSTWVDDLPRHRPELTPPVAVVVEVTPVIRTDRPSVTMCVFEFHYFIHSLHTVCTYRVVYNMYRYVCIGVCMGLPGLRLSVNRSFDLAGFSSFRQRSRSVSVGVVFRQGGGRSEMRRVRSFVSWWFTRRHPNETTHDAGVPSPSLSSPVGLRICATRRVCDKTAGRQAASALVLDRCASVY